jgi:hypothetical protein
MQFALIGLSTKMFQASPHYVIYVSLAVGRMNAEQLNEVSGEVARRYEQNQVTGASLYAESRFITKLEGRFLHMLEASEEDLQAVYEMCLKNTWEHGLIKVARGSCTHRLYSTWSLTSLCPLALHTHVCDNESCLNSSQVMSWHQGSSDHRLMMLNHFCQLNGWAGEAHPQMTMPDFGQELIET